jgi:hypothetical protein
MLVHLSVHRASYRSYHTPNLVNMELHYLTRNLDAVNPDVSVHSEGDTAVQDGGVKTMWLLQYKTYGTLLIKI